MFQVSSLSSFVIVRRVRADPKGALALTTLHMQSFQNVMSVRVVSTNS